MLNVCFGFVVSLVALIWKRFFLLTCILIKLPCDYLIYIKLCVDPILFMKQTISVQYLMDSRFMRIIFLSLSLLQVNILPIHLALSFPFHPSCSFISYCPIHYVLCPTWHIGRVHLDANWAFKIQTVLKIDTSLSLHQCIWNERPNLLNFILIVLMSKTLTIHFRFI